MTPSAYMPGLMSKMKPDILLSRPRSGPVTATPVALSRFCIDRMLNRESLRKHCCARVFPTGFTVASVSTSAWKFATLLPTCGWLRPATMTPHLSECSIRRRGVSAARRWRSLEKSPERSRFQCGGRSTSPGNAPAASASAAALANFQALIDDLDQSSETLPLDELTEHAIDVTGLLDYHRSEKGERGQARVENLQELVTATRLFEPEDETISPLQAFLDSAALDAGEGQADPYEDSIQMMTLHSAKGLEFPLVFIAGMEENLFPHQMSLEEPGRLEEERRLAYVGITRAMKNWSSLTLRTGVSMEGICTTPLPLYPGDSQRAARGSPLERLRVTACGVLGGRLTQ
ncbi:MAG: hypothetical protein CM15mP74_13080 [Halieaceae bacterium]|nr:MAG: hypothetical protein CM15mP74_13080 [Halieaceae bacterium]